MDERATPWQPAFLGGGAMMSGEWSPAHDLVNLYLGIAHLADNELDPEEQRTFMRKFGQWMPNVSVEQFERIWGDVISLYESLGSHENRYAVYLQSAVNVARLMGEMGLQGLPRKRFRRTTDSNHARPVAPNVLERKFEAERPNQFWVTDITFIWTREGWLYLAAIIELFSRRVVGWAMQPHMRTELALEALHMALGRCLPDVGLVHHSDRGVQYAATTYQAALDDNNIVCSMSRKGDCWDNAVSESFFGTLKTELINRHSWSTRREAKNAVVDYIESFYNPHRLHSSLGYVSPIEFERMHIIEMSCTT